MYDPQAIALLIVSLSKEPSLGVFVQSTICCRLVIWITKSSSTTEGCHCLFPCILPSEYIMLTVALHYPWMNQLFGHRMPTLTLSCVVAAHLHHVRLCFSLPPVTEYSISKFCCRLQGFISKGTSLHTSTPSPQPAVHPSGGRQQRSWGWGDG